MTPDPEKAKIHSAEAQRLRDDPAFHRAMLAAKKRCLEQLADVDPHDIEEIKKTQATIRSIDLMAEMIADEIIRGMQPRQVVAA